MVVDEKNMESDESWEQDHEDQHKSCCKPVGNHRSKIIRPAIFPPEESNWQNEEKQMNPCGQDHAHEKFVIELTNAIIYPYTVMIKDVDAPTINNNHTDHTAYNDVKLPRHNYDNTHSTNIYLYVDELYHNKIGTQATPSSDTSRQ